MAIYVYFVVEWGAQIDLVINRDDDAITLCEIKYTEKPLVMNKAYAENLQRKIEVFKKQTKTEKLIFVALMASNGVSSYIDNFVHNVVILEELFETA